jgi:hypothetical protein
MPYTCFDVFLWGYENTNGIRQPHFPLSKENYPETLYLKLVVENSGTSYFNASYYTKEIIPLSKGEYNMIFGQDKGRQIMALEFRCKSITSLRIVNSNFSILRNVNI